MDRTLYAKARKLRNELEELRETKALELVDILNNHPETNIIYDWYQGTDPDLDCEVTQYIIVSKSEITALNLKDGDLKTVPEPSNFFGHLRYNVCTKKPIKQIVTDLKTYNLQRP